MFGNENNVMTSNVAKYVASTPGTHKAQGIALSVGTIGVSWVLVVLVGLYLLWAIVHQHEKVQEQIKPSNVAVNLHNLFAIALPVIVFILLLKVFTAKYQAWGLPGGDVLSQVVGAL